MTWIDLTQPSESGRLRKRGWSWHDMQGMWHDYKGRVRQRVGERFNEDVDHLVDAYKEEFSGKLQRIYDLSKEEADREIEERIALDSAGRQSMQDEGSHPMTTM